MEWHYIAATISGILAAVAGVPYIIDTFRRETRPNVVTWGLWSIIQFIFIAAQFSSGASLSVVLPLVEVVTTAAIVALGLIGYGYEKYGWLDGVCLVIAIAAIASWQLTNNPIYALWLSVLADFVASVPALYKSYHDAESETLSTYALVVFSAIFAILSTTIYDLANLLWPIYIAFNSALFVILLVVGRRMHPAKQNAAQ